MSAKVYNIRDYDSRRKKPVVNDMKTLEMMAIEIYNIAILGGPGGIDDLLIDTSPSEMPPPEAS